MILKLAKNLTEGDLLHIAGLTFRVAQVGVFFEEATITLWPQHRTRLDNKMVICIDRDAFLKTHSDKIEV
jgi:hypothetical protein